MKIPLVDLRAQYLSCKEEIDKAVAQVLISGEFILSKAVTDFEREFAKFNHAKYCIGTASGTAALHLALLACGVGRDDLVVTTPFTFIATTEAISYTGATPIFVDIDPNTMTLDADQLHTLLEQPRQYSTSHKGAIKAIVPVHLFGHPVDMQPVLELGRAYGIRVIEDCAQAHGARHESHLVGSIGDIGCFSFFPAKNLGAYGDAGAVVTNDKNLADRVRLLSNHGRVNKYEHMVEGFNYRLDSLQAAILHVKLQHLEQWTERRRRIAKQYNELLYELPLWLPVESSWAYHVYHQYVIRHKERSLIRTELGRRGIEAGLHYPIPLHLQPAYVSLGYRRGAFPNAEQAANACLSLPIFAELTDEQQGRITEAMIDIFRSR